MMPVVLPIAAAFVGRLVARRRLAPPAELPLMPVPLAMLAVLLGGYTLTRNL